MELLSSNSFTDRLKSFEGHKLAKQSLMSNFKHNECSEKQSDIRDDQAYFFRCIIASYIYSSSDARSYCKLRSNYHEVAEVFVDWA